MLRSGQPATRTVDATRRPLIRPATAADLIAFYGRPPPASVRALVAVLDGRPVGIGGIKYEHGADGQPLLVAFSDLAPEMRAYPVAIMRAARRVMDLLRGRPAIALADPAQPNAPAFLIRLGFVHATTTEEGDFYRVTTGADIPDSTPDREGIRCSLYRSIRNRPSDSSPSAR